MKNKIIVIALLLLSIILHNGCEHCGCFCSKYDARELNLNETEDFTYTELYCNPKHEIRLSFDSLQDGRCPIGAECFWEGNGSVRVHIQQPGETTAVFWLNTHGNFLTDTLVNGIRYKLVDILPYPEVGKVIQPEEVILQMRISD